MRRARVYGLGSKVAACGLSFEADAPRVIRDPVITTEADAPDSELGEALRKALDGSRMGLAPRSDEERERAEQEFVDLFGFRSWWSFVRAGAVSCLVEEDGEVLQFHPSRNDGKGFEGVREWEFTIPLDSPVQVIGAAVRKGLEIAQ